MSTTPQQLELDFETERLMDPFYEDGPVSITDIPTKYQSFNRVNWFRLEQMIERWPAMRKSWEAFIIDYNMCLSTLEAEELNDDIPF